jgi:HAD superfamily hydrolase (TIGR01490 family)
MKTLIAFDFDGTLTRKDSFLSFVFFVKGGFFLIKNAPYLASLWLLLKLGILDRGLAKQKVFKHCFRGMPLEKFDGHCQQFSEVIDRMIRKGARACIKHYHREKIPSIIVSASIKNWIEPWAQKNNIASVIATEIETDAKGQLTGRFKTPNCKGEEKVRRLAEKFPDRSSYRLLAYGDSQGDRELLEHADIAYWKPFK